MIDGSKFSSLNLDRKKARAKADLSPELKTLSKIISLYYDLKLIVPDLKM